MGRRKLLLCSYDFLVRSMSTLDKNEGGFRGAPYFGAVPPNSYGTPPLKVSIEISEFRAFDRDLNEGASYFRFQRRLEILKDLSNSWNSPILTVLKMPTVPRKIAGFWKILFYGGGSALFYELWTVRKKIWPKVLFANFRTFQKCESSEIELYRTFAERNNFCF